MWRTKSARRGSESAGSISVQPLLDDDKLYLPDSDIYVTTTKSGRPAIARKKHRDVLRDHGFDILGQSLGIPSRGDFNRGRPIGVADQRRRSQSTYSTPTPRTIEVDTEEEIALASNTKQNRDPSRSSTRVPATPRSILRSSNTPKNSFQEPPETSSPLLNKMDYKSRPRSQTCSRPAMSERTRFATDCSDDESLPIELNAPGTSFYTPLASPHSHASATPTNNFYEPPVTPMYPRTTFPAPAPSTSATPAAYSNLSANLSSQQAQSFGVQFPTTAGPGFFMPPPTFMAPQGQQSTMPAAYSQQNFVPPPPPPPPGIMPDGITATFQNDPATAETYDDERIKEHFDTITKTRRPDWGDSQIASQIDTPANTPFPDIYHTPNVADPIQDGKEGQAASRERLNEEKTTKTPKHKSTPDISILHMHVCAGCGKTRSKGYHMTHPLKKGDRPEPDYCRRCVTNAEYTDSEATDSAIGRDYLMTPALPVAERHHDQTSPVSELHKSKSTTTAYSQKKHGRRNSLLRVVSSVLPRGARRKRTASLSTPEEASSRGSSPTGQPRVYRRPDSRMSRQSSSKVSHTLSSQHGSTGQHRGQRSPGILVTSLSSSMSNSLERLPYEDDLELCQVSQRERNGSTGKRVEKSNPSPTVWRQSSSARNFSYKSSPLMPPTASVYDHGADARPAPENQQPIIRTEASGVSERRKDKRVKDARRAGGSKLSSSTNRSTIESHMTRSDRVNDPNVSKTSVASHQPLMPATSVGTHTVESHSQSRRRDSLASQSISAWDTQGIFNKAPKFDEISDHRDGSPLRNPGSEATSRERRSNKSDSSSQKSSQDPGYNNEGKDLGLFDEAPDLSHLCRNESYNQETNTRVNLEHSGSSHDSGVSKSSTGKTGRKIASDYGGMRHHTPKINSAWDTPLPGSNDANYNSSHCDSSSKHSSTKNSSHKLSTFDPLKDYGTPQDEFNLFESSASRNNSGNVFCTWDERGAESEPELLSPAQDHFDSMPATPAYGWDENETEPQVRHDSWEHSQSHFEQQAEQMVESMVEEDLLRAESCDPDEERNDGNAHYQLSNESDIEGSATFDEKDVKQIEFSGHSDLSRSRVSFHRSSPRSSRSKLSTKRHPQTSSQTNSHKSNATGRNEMFEQPRGDQELPSGNSSPDFITTAEGSSILAHTGHSEDNVGTLDMAQDDKSTTSSTRTPRRRVRRFGL